MAALVDTFVRGQRVRVASKYVGYVIGFVEGGERLMVTTADLFTGEHRTFPIGDIEDAP